MVKKVGNIRPSIGHYILLSMKSLIVSVPFIWLLFSALKSPEDYSINPFGFPKTLMFSNFVTAWNQINMLSLFKNSIFICVVSVVLGMFIATMASYALSRFNFKINLYTYNYFLVGMMIPLNGAIIPLFISLRNYHLLNTYWGVILPYIAFNLPMEIFLITGFMKSIPNEIEESAVIDGCGVMGIFTKIILPLSTPIFSTTAILVFVGLWNEFLFALLFLSGSEHKTVPIGIMSFQGEHLTDFTLMFAAMITAIIPTMLIFIILRKSVMRGMTAGAVKD